MTIPKINHWARWIELGQDFPGRKDSLDISQVSDLVQELQKKFSSSPTAKSLYSGLIEVAQKLLPAPELGFGLAVTPEIACNTYYGGFHNRLKVLPLKDGDICMSAQAFRLALIGKAVFGESEKSQLFYALGTKEKKYILRRQPDLLPFRTDLPNLVGNSSLVEILWGNNSPMDLLHDAALFGGDALIEALEILKTMVPQLCKEEAFNLQKILSSYPLGMFIDAPKKEFMAYLLVRHQLELFKGGEIPDGDICHLFDLMNDYCNGPGSQKGLYSLILPENPLRRGETLLFWLKERRIKEVHMHLTSIDKIYSCNQLGLGKKAHNPARLMEEYDAMSVEDKKGFILKIIFHGKIEALQGASRAEFIQKVEEREKNDRPWSALLKLALFCVDFQLPQVEKGTYLAISDVCDRKLLDEIHELENQDKIWFLETFLMHKGCAGYFLRTGKFLILQALFSGIRDALGSSVDMNPLLRDYVDRILEICPVEHVSLALTSLGCREKLAVCLKQYVKRNLTNGVFDENVARTCKKFFEVSQEGIAFILSIATLETKTDKFVLNEPCFSKSIPERYQEEIQLLEMLLQPLAELTFDPLSRTMQRLPLGLKELLMEDSSFSSFFEKEVMGRVLSLYKQGCVLPEEMFFLATKLPYPTFLEVAEKCPIVSPELHPEITLYGTTTSISNHIISFFMMILEGDDFAQEDLRKFLNRYPKMVSGEGRWIQYLARHVPILFSQGAIEKIFELLPMDLVPFMVQFVLPEHQEWLLDSRFEAIYTKNIDKFSVGVLAWLLENLEQWFLVRRDVIEYTLFLWERPRRNLKAKLDLLEETKNLFCIFFQRFSTLQSLHQKLRGKPGSEKLSALLEELGQIKGVITPWYEKMDTIDLESISDIVNGEILEGEIYALEGKGWISKKTRDRLDENPFTKIPFLSQEDKDQRVPPLNQEELRQLDENRGKIVIQITELRNAITEKGGNKKRMTIDLS